MAREKHYSLQTNITPTPKGRRVMTLYPEWLEEHKAEVALPERIRKMRAAYGKRDDQLCKNCKFFERHQAGGKWFKCGKSKITGGQGTDWRANWKACGKFEESKAEE